MKRRKQLRAYPVECGGARVPKKASDAKVRNHARVTSGCLSKQARDRQTKRIRYTTSRVSMGNWVRAHTGGGIESPDRVMPEGVCLATYLGELNSTRR